MHNGSIMIDVYFSYIWSSKWVFLVGSSLSKMMQGSALLISCGSAIFLMGLLGSLCYLHQAGKLGRSRRRRHTACYQFGQEEVYIISAHSPLVSTNYMASPRFKAGWDSSPRPPTTSQPMRGSPVWAQN